MSKVKRYWKKNMIHSIVMTLLGVVGILIWYLNMGNKGFESLQAIGIAFTISGVVMGAIYWFGRNNKGIKDTLVAENDEMAKILQCKAGAFTNKVTFFIVIASLVFESFIKVSLWEYLVFLVGSISLAWAGAFCFYVKKNC